jgi:hypothetical protein
MFYNYSDMVTLAYGWIFKLQYHDIHGKTIFASLFVIFNCFSCSQVEKLAQIPRQQKSREDSFLIDIPMITMKDNQHSSFFLYKTGVSNLNQGPDLKNTIPAEI